jgi:hypothetical protein
MLVVSGKVWSAQSDADSLVKGKSHPNLLTYTPTGPEIMSLISGIIAARSLFDSGSLLIEDLLKMKLRLERANHGFLTVDHLHTWKALRVTFQCFSQKLNSWAKSPQACTEPRLSGFLQAADFLWGKADAQAFLVSTIDPAWAAQPGAGGKWSKGFDLSALSARERQSIAAEIRTLDSSRAKKPGSTTSPSSGTPATGGGKTKTKGSSLWPDHIRVVCPNYGDGKADCKRYCYLTRDRRCFATN